MRSRMAASRRVWTLTPERAWTSRVARAACDARGRVEIAPCHVDGDALLALGDETVEQQAEIERARRRPLRLLERQSLVGVHGAGVAEQPPDQRRLAVVDRAAGENLQRLAARRPGLHGGSARRRPMAHRRSMLPDL